MVRWLTRDRIAILAALAAPLAGAAVLLADMAGRAFGGRSYNVS